jgi:hypothetical protein
VTITREDLTIEHSTSRWGGPVARISVEFPQAWTGEPETRTFELKSTEGLDPIAKERHSIHVGEIGERVRDNDWRGCLRTVDMEEAIGEFVDWLNHLVERQSASSATEGARARLSEALTDFGDSLDDRSWRDFRTEYANAKAAFVALDMVMAEHAGKDGEK